MNEIPIIEKFIKDKLKNDSVIFPIIGSKVFGYEVRAGSMNGTGSKAIIFSLQGGSDTNGTGGVRLMARPIYQIKVVTSGGLDDDAVTVVNRIDEIFQGLTMETVVPGVHISSRRIQLISYREPGGENESGFRHLGGLYRIDVY